MQAKIAVLGVGGRMSYPGELVSRKKETMVQDYQSEKEAVVSLLPSIVNSEHLEQEIIIKVVELFHVIEIVFNC